MIEAESLATSTVSITVRNVRPVIARHLFALVDVEIDLDGVALTIFGVQARRLPSGGTDILMPSTRRPDGSWVPAVDLPGELANSLTVIVLNFLIEEGLAYNRLEALPRSAMPLQPR